MKSSRLVAVSLPLWERGLKYNNNAAGIRFLSVAPLVGAWIEIHVTPPGKIPVLLSLPLWERGLKFSMAFVFVMFLCRSPCGSVD